MKHYLLTKEEIQAIKDKWIGASWEDLCLKRKSEFFTDFERLMDHYMALRKIEELKEMGIIEECKKNMNKQ